MADWDDFYAAKRSASTRRRDRSKRKRLAQYGEVKFVTSMSASGALDTLGVLIAQKSAVLARHGIANFFTRPGYTAFFRDFASNPRSRRLAHAAELRVGDEIAAANLGLVFKGRYYYVLSSYTESEMAHWGPGAAHLHELMRYAIAHKCTVFDFTVGDEPYKRDWCETVAPLSDHLSAMRWRGALMVPLLIAMMKLKREIKQSPLWWNLFSKVRSLTAPHKPSRRTR
jgi:CelD/BcsL family acetyltransferase involved in cellulose biosynthesis